MSADVPPKSKRCGDLVAGDRAFGGRVVEVVAWTAHPDDGAEGPICPMVDVYVVAAPMLGVRHVYPRPAHRILSPSVSVSA